MEELTNAGIEQVDPSSYTFDVTAGFNGEVADAVGAPEATASAIDAATATDATTTPAAETETAESTPGNETTPTTESETEDRVFNFKAKRDRAEVDASVKESELPTMWQKAQNMDRAVQRANEAQARIDELNAKLTRFAAVGKATLGLEGDDPETILASMETGMMDTAVKSRARTFHNTDAEIAEAHVRSTLKDTIEQSVAQFGVNKTAEQTTGDSSTGETADTSASVKLPDGVPSFAQFQADLEKLIAIRPDLKDVGTQFPKEVITAYQSGVDLFTAYSAFESKKVAAENAQLKAANAVLQQNHASAKKAPIRRGVSGSNLADMADDKWTAGFNDSLWG